MTLTRLPDPFCNVREAFMQGRHVRWLHLWIPAEVGLCHHDAPHNQSVQVTLGVLTIRHVFQQWTLDIFAECEDDYHRWKLRSTILVAVSPAYEMETVLWFDW
jgi:hypothetical protein